MFKAHWIQLFIFTITGRVPKELTLSVERCQLGQATVHVQMHGRILCRRSSYRLEVSFIGFGRGEPAREVIFPIPQRSSPGNSESPDHFEMLLIVAAGKEAPYTENPIAFLTRRQSLDVDRWVEHEAILSPVPSNPATSEL